MRGEQRCTGRQSEKAAAVQDHGDGARARDRRAGRQEGDEHQEDASAHQDAGGLQDRSLCHINLFGRK